VTAQDVLAQYQDRIVELDAAIGEFLPFQRHGSQSRLWRLKRYYQRALQRINGDWMGSAIRGEEFSDPNHVYAADLNLFGQGSLFELLCTTRTAIGRRGLANCLLKAPPLEEILLRQNAVRELSQNAELREKVATLGEFEFLESRRDAFDEWLNSPKYSFFRFLPSIAAATSSVLAAIVLGGLFGVIPWSYVALWISPLILFHASIGLRFRTRVNRMTDSLRSVFTELGVLRQGLRLLETEQFESTKLRDLSAQARHGFASLQKLERLLNALEQRNKEWFYGPSLLLLIGTQLCMAIERWRAQQEEALKTWLRVWAEFEALNALATYAYENPEHSFPELTSGEVCFRARDLGHPLLPRDGCITNDVELDPAFQFYVVSGSNMSGKSTLLRTIGLNAVLAFAGAPVRASAMQLSSLTVVASLSVGDSLSEGKSKFAAEVGRLRQAIHPDPPDRAVLFLVDEIFGGTNSRDRRIAAEAVVRTLVRRGAIGAFSTHDLSLTEIATAEGMHGINVHMGSRDQNDPMDFDYRLKPGVTQEANALMIARMAGVEI
jgi:hypothetical protein